MKAMGKTTRCGYCGGPVGRAAQARYCSTACKRAAFLDRRRAGKLARHSWLWRRAVCQHCGSTFNAERATARFCGAACRQAHYREANAARLEREREKRRLRLRKQEPGPELRGLLNSLTAGRNVT